MFTFTAGLAVMVLALLSIAPRAEAQTGGPPAEALRALAGTWTYTRELRPSPAGPGGTATGTDSNELLGDFFLLRRYDETGPGGRVIGIDVLGYDPARRLFTDVFFNSTGASGSGTVTVTGNTWQFLANGTAGGRTFLQRCTLSLALTGLSFTMTCDTSTDGQLWAPRFEGRWTKTTPR